MSAPAEDRSFRHARLARTRARVPRRSYDQPEQVRPMGGGPRRQERSVDLAPVRVDRLALAAWILARSLDHRQIGRGAGHDARTPRPSSSSPGAGRA
jgi:hypothetical protein